MGKRKAAKSRAEEKSDVAVVKNDESSNVNGLVDQIDGMSLVDKKEITLKKSDVKNKKIEIEDDMVSASESDSDAESEESVEEEESEEDSDADSDEEESSEEDSDEESDESSEEEKVAPKKQNAFASKFGMAGMDDMCDDDDDESDESSSDSDRAPTPPPVKRNQKKPAPKKVLVESSESEEEQPKKKAPVKKNFNKNQKNNKKKGDDDDDFDSILDDFRAKDGLPPPPPKQQGKQKPKGKNNKAKNDDDDFDSILAASRAEDNLPSPPAKQQQKNNKKGKKKDDDDDFDAVLAEARAEVGIPAPVQEEAKPIEEPVVDEEVENNSSKKRRRKNKAASVEPKTEEASEESKPDVPVETKPEATKPEGAPKPKPQPKKQEKKGPAKKGGLNEKTKALLREQQEKLRELEEQEREEAERLEREENERVAAAIEKKRVDEEKRERKRLRDKERKQKLKEEGKLLTPKERANQKRAMELLMATGQINKLTEKEEGKKETSSSKISAKKQRKLDKEAQKLKEVEKLKSVNKSSTSPPNELKKEDSEEVKESWELSSDEEEPSTTSNTSTVSGSKSEAVKSKEKSQPVEEEEDDDDKRAKIIARLRKRREKHEAAKSLDNLRSPVVCVLGHVDHGKTKILDKLRRTNVQEGEVGGITQQIGATNVPYDAIGKQTHMVKTFDFENLKLPGLLIIDTPGHESFSNLRNRGSSLCDIAVLVIDITQGLEPQTLESIDLLKKRKTPFVVVLNKIDMLYEWQTNPHKDIKELLDSQQTTTKNDFEKRFDNILLKLNENGLNAALFWKNPDPRSYVSLIPTSAITGDGMGNLIALVCQMCQEKLAAPLQYCEELRCTVLEVKTIVGHGTTIDVILVDGRLREGDTVVLAGTDGAIVTQIRSLLLPKPMKEIRVKGAYDEMKEVVAAQGIKIAAKDMDKAIAGLTIRVARNEDEIPILKEVVEKELHAAMRDIKVKDKGVYVQASTLGALEALLEFFKTKDIPYSNIRVGPVVKKDVMKAAAMHEHDSKYAVILAFDVKVEKDAQELADKERVSIFSEETIYHLGDRYVEFLEEHKRRLQEENKLIAIFPCKLKIIPTAIFNKRDPIIIGVSVEAGILRLGTPLCVPSKEFVEIGIVTSLEFDHKEVDMAKKGVEVCIKIEVSGGDSGKYYGRQFEYPDEIVSKISRESINACKDYFRDDLSKGDWKLMAELKKLFEIL